MNKSQHIVEGSEQGTPHIDGAGNGWVVFANVATMIMTAGQLQPFLAFLLETNEELSA